MSTHRNGFGLIELLLVMVLGLIILGAAYDTLIRQDQSYRVFSAMSATQQDTRTGLDLLSAELRELSTTGADMVMATPDSVRFRALRKFGLLCDKDKVSRRLVVAQVGLDPFRAGDSLLVYVDGDSLQAADDRWERDYVSSVTTSVTCGTTLGLSLAGLLPSASLIELTTDMSLKFDSVFPGAPVRSFEMLTYKQATWEGQPTLVRVRGNDVVPLLGPLDASNGFQLRYYDGMNNEMTAFPFSAADRASVRRIEVTLDAARVTGPNERHTDVLVTDVYLRGS